MLATCIAAGAIIEPRVLQARRVRQEQEAWARLEASPKRYEDYAVYERSTAIPRRLADSG